MNAKAETHRAAVPLIIADIFELAGAFRRFGETIARTAGQTQARWQVLSAASGKALTVPQIARRLGVSRQNVQRIADLLVAEKLAAFSANPDHRGSPHLVLSERGQDRLARLTEAGSSFHQAIADHGRALDFEGLRRDLGALAALVYTLDTGDGQWIAPSSPHSRTAPTARSREP